MKLEALRVNLKSINKFTVEITSDNIRIPDAGAYLEGGRTGARPP